MLKNIAESTLIISKFIFRNYLWKRKDDWSLSLTKNLVWISSDDKIIIDSMSKFILSIREASKNEHPLKYHVSSADVTSFWDPEISKLSEKSCSNSRIDVFLFVCTRVSIENFFVVISGTSSFLKSTFFYNSLSCKQSLQWQNHF